LTLCPSAPLAEDSPTWFRHLVAAARSRTSEHGSLPCPNFFEFVRQAELPWLWWQPSQWPVAGELNSLLLLPPPSSCQPRRQDLIFVAPHLYFGVQGKLLRSSSTAWQVPPRSARASMHTQLHSYSPPTLVLTPTAHRCSNSLDLCPTSSASLTIPHPLRRKQLWRQQPERQGTTARQPRPPSRS